MSNEDFIFLNVPGLLSRYGVTNEGVPDADRRNLIISYTKTQLDFFRDQGLLLTDSRVMEMPVAETILKFSDFTGEGQRFIMTGATDKWLQSCDKKGDLASYQDPTGLIRRLDKFRATTI